MLKVKKQCTIVVISAKVTAIFFYEVYFMYLLYILCI